ncbi:MAG: hypothetical protein KA104_02740 [Candidatus Pacebacteria bacterium]|nr:hypothetical protein [Candidatus Paceibacterota bacterium]
MVAMPPGRFAPVIELLDAGLASCVVSFFNNPRKPKSSTSLPIERHWTLDVHSPLLMSFIAITSVAHEWAYGEDLEKALWVGRLFCSLDSRPEEDFLAVTKRLLDRMKRAGSTVFAANQTLSGHKTYYVMMNDEDAQYLIREAEKVHGSTLELFIDAVTEKFIHLTAFGSAADSFRQEWHAARVPA